MKTGGHCSKNGWGDSICLMLNRDEPVNLLRTLFICLLALPLLAEERTLNNGNLVLQDIPKIPDEIRQDLSQHQNVRSASFQAWGTDVRGLFIKTRFGDVTQLHRVDQPGGARSQLTFFDEPLGSVSRKPLNDELIFTMDADGSEFSQVFLMDPATGRWTMLTDGESRNHSVRWARDGSTIAWTSTARNGRSNDIWQMDPDNPRERQMIFESPDGTSWAAIDFARDGKSLLFRNYVSINDVRIHLLDLTTGLSRMLAGGTETRSANYAVGFDAEDKGFFFLTDLGSEYTQLAWAPVDDPSAVKQITTGINWDVEYMVLSDDRKRGAFVVNAGGINELYLFDTKSHRYRQVTELPTGLIGRMRFRPDSHALAMTLNSPRTPSDTFVLTLGRRALDAGELTRWTFSEVGGLDTDRFIDPTLVEFNTFDDRMIPAFYYRPRGEGPHPVVISIHGGPEGQALPGFSSTYQMWLEKLGVAILVPNVRGSAGYGKSYLQLDNGYRREDSVKDIGALLDWIATRSELDKDRVAVFGGSYGGYMVLASSVHYSDRLKAAVDIVGISSFVTFLENTQDYRRDLRRVEYGDERDPDMRAFLNSISPLNNTSKIRIPMLVVQGENDPRVPVSESIQLIEALRENNQTVWYMNALNEGHGYRKKENRDIYQQATVLFLKTHLLGN